jgi:hypothetical protein
MNEFKMFLSDNDDHDGNGPRPSKRRRLKDRAAELESRKVSLRDDVRFYNELGEEDCKNQGLAEIAKVNTELKQVRKEIDEEEKNDKSH